MNKLYRLFCVLTFLMGIVCTINAQDAVFSQYFSSSLYLSPCFAGLEHNTNVSINTRTQWKSVTVPYTTHQVSLIVPFYKYGLTDNNIGGVGISIYQDKAGDFGFQTLGANINGAYNLRVAEQSAITFGIRLGLIQKQINLEKLQWGSQFDQYMGFNKDYPADPLQDAGALAPRKTLFDVGAGFLYCHKNNRDIREKGGGFWIGYAGYHLNRPNESLIETRKSPMPILHKALAGFELTLGSRFNLSPNVLVNMQGKDVSEVKGLTNMQTNAGMYITYMFVEPEANMVPKDVILGGWYRLNDSFIASLGLVSRVYTIGFSYDLNQSSLKVATKGRGAWEVSLKIEIPRKEKVKRYYTPRI